MLLTTQYSSLTVRLSCITISFSVLFCRQYQQQIILRFTSSVRRFAMLYVAVVTKRHWQLKRMPSVGKHQISPGKNQEKAQVVIALRMPIQQ